MQNNSSTVSTLNAADSSRVQVGNTYNTTNHYHNNTSQANFAQTLRDFSSTDPRHDKERIEGGDLHRDSYKWILDNEEFSTWRDEGNGGRLLWIKGDAGKGKTMLLCGIIDELQSSTKLSTPDSRIYLSYFFCQAADSRLSNSTAVLQGLIYLLILQQPSLFSHISDTPLSSTTDPNYRIEMEKLFHRIIADPAIHGIYLLVDALDECLADLQSLLRLISTTSSRVKWIVSSRKRCEIDEILGQTPTNLPLCLELHEHSISQAVLSYIDYRTEVLAKRKKYTPEQAQQVHSYLSKHARGTFLWVALVCDKLSKRRAWETNMTLLEFPEGLSNLFARMVNQILASDSSGLYIKLLAITSTVFRPLTFSELIAMGELPIKRHSVPDFISECGSFLTTKEETVFFIHQSAKDYLLTKADISMFPSGASQHHFQLFRRSIGMLEGLSKDMYNLVYPGVTLEEAVRRRPIPDPLESLGYACVSWADHLEQGYMLYDKEEDKVKSFPEFVAAHRFIADRFLFWLEALSILKNLSAAANTLLFLQSLPLSLSPPDKSELVRDAYRFFLLFCPIIQNYPLQIYVSGLLFSPQKSVIRRRFKAHIPEYFETTPEVETTWGPIWSILETGCWAEDVKFSTTSPMQIIVQSNQEIMKWGVNHGSMHDRTKYENVKMLAASPDSEWLALIIPSESNKTGHVINALRVLDSKTKEITWTQEIGVSPVYRIEISTDSQRLAVCYGDKFQLFAREGDVSRIWPIEPHLDIRGPIAFSSEYTLLLTFPKSIGASTARVVDLQSGKQYNSPKLDNEGIINDAKFIPGTCLVMLCFDAGPLYLWDVLDQKFEEWAFLDSYLVSIAFSNNTSWVAVATSESLLLYDRHERSVLQELELPFSENLPSSLVFSPNDEKIAIGDEDRIWVVDIPSFLNFKPSSLMRQERSLWISNSGRLVAFVFNDKIEIRDTTTGKPLSVLVLEGNTKGIVWTVSFSPDDQQMVFVDESSVFVWDLAAAKLQPVCQGPGIGPLVALSNKQSHGSQWVAASTFRQSVCLFDITLSDRQRLIRPTDPTLRHPDALAFAGCKLGVLWCFADPESESKDALFVLYNIQTGEQVSQIKTPWQWSLVPHFSSRLFLSPDGMFMIIQLRGCRHLRLSILDFDMVCFQISATTSDMSFLNEKTVSTAHGTFSLTSILQHAIHQLKSGGQDSTGTGNRPDEVLCTVTPTFEGYGCSLGFDWIVLDDKPLLWIPQQYRGDMHSTIATGHCHVMIKSHSSLYFVGFKSGAKDTLRSAIDNLALMR